MRYLIALFLTSANAQTLPMTVAAQNATRGTSVVVHVGAHPDHDRTR